MIGLTAEAEDGLDWSNLSDDLARKAALHSLHELNGVPAWLDRLTEAKPAIVRQVYREQLAWEMTLPADTQHANGLMHDLAYGDRFIQELCVPDVQDLIQNNEPLHLGILQYALRVLSNQNAAEFLKSVAPNRARNALLSGDQKRFAIWFSIWLQVDCSTALDFLAAQQWANPEEADEMVLMICDNLYAHHSATPQVANPSYLDLQNLPRFLDLLYTHVKPSEDQIHEGVHSPDARDNAQQFRGDVLRQLIESSPEMNAYDLASKKWTVVRRLFAPFALA